METIRNYLESMFKNLPQTEAVIKAKYELGQMMEDKYVELLKEGKTESEAVGTVISEFGNLEELAADLGIDEVYKKTRTSNINRRKVSLDEAKKYLAAAKKKSVLMAIGIALCISCCTPPIVTSAFGIDGKYGATGLFLFIAIAVSLFILGNAEMDDFKFLEREPCSIEPSVMDTVKAGRREFSTTYSILSSIGIILIILCVIPPIILSGSHSDSLPTLSGAMLFWFISAGVALLSVAKGIQNSHLKLLNLNKNSIYWNDYVLNNGSSGNTSDTSSTENVYSATSASASATAAPAYKKTKYKSKAAKTFMEIYWPLMVCIYLCWSFTTFMWYISWIVWPIAGVLFPLCKTLLTEEEEN